MKKYFLVATSLLIIIIALFTMASAPQIAEITMTQVDQVQEMMSQMMDDVLIELEETNPELVEDTEETAGSSPFDLTELMTADYLIRCVYITQIIAIILSLITFETAMNGHILKHKKRTVAFSIIQILTAVTILIPIIALINLIVVLALERKTEEDYPDKVKPVEPLEEPDHSKKGIIKGLLTILLYVLCHVGFAIIVAIINVDYLDTTWFEYASFGVDLVLFAILIYMHKEELKAGLKAIKENKAGYTRTIIRRTLIGFLCMAVFNVIRIIFTGNTFANNQDTLNEMPLMLTAVLAVIWAPIVEELVFRGAIRSFIKNKTAFIIVASIVFGALHAITEDGIFNIIVTSLPYIALGTCLSCAYAKTNNIWVNICMHAINNAVAVIAMFMIFGM